MALDISPEQLVELMQTFSQAFDTGCRQRLEVGVEEYGQFKFLENNTFDMLCEELLDIANYARFTYLKVRLLEAGVLDARSVDSTSEPVGESSTGTLPPDASSFVGVSEVQAFLPLTPKE